MKPNIKKIIIIVVVIAILGVGYKYFFVKSAPAKPASALKSSNTTTAKTTTTTATKTVANKKVDKDTEFLSTLLSISKINVDATIFASPSFNSLQDNNVPIANDETAGRVNPFAPFEAPIDIVTTTNTTTNTNALKEIIPSAKN